MRALITGISGFVARYLAADLLAAGWEVWGMDLRPATVDGIDGGRLAVADLLDADAVRGVVRAGEPEVVFHLAAQSNPALSWKIPRETFDVNVHGTRHVVEAAGGVGARVLVVSSSDIYGSPPSEAMPMTESQPPDPRNPYAVSKLAAERLAAVVGPRAGAPILVVRPFSHTGPGQGLGFVAPDFADRVARLESEGGGVLRHGDLSAQRDFTDVRDVVRAYRLLAESGLTEGIFHVCSGRSRTIQSILDHLISRSSALIRQELDPDLARGEKPTEKRGDYSALKAATGWEPRIALEDTLDELLEERRAMERAGGPA